MFFNPLLPLDEVLEQSDGDDIEQVYEEVLSSVAQDYERIAANRVACASMLTTALIQRRMLAKLLEEARIESASYKAAYDNAKETVHRLVREHRISSDIGIEIMDAIFDGQLGVLCEAAGESMPTRKLPRLETELN